MKPLTAEEIAAIRQRVGGEPVPTGFAIAVSGASVLHLLAAYELLAKLGAEALTEDANIHAILADLAEWAEKEGIAKAEYSR